MKKSDNVMTPEWVAKKMLEHFKPTGRILDPCRGSGVFSSLIDGCEWCEIKDGRDFYNCSGKYDWIIGNPPYSVFSNFLRHSFKLADNICYLIPANKVFNSYRMMKEVVEYGGVKEMLVIAPGAKLKFPIGFCIAAVFFQREYKGEMKINFI